MATDTRRFADMVATITDLRQQLSSLQSTALSRLSSHTHAADAGKVNTSRQILTGSQLTGGGDLSADRTINLVLPLVYDTSWTAVPLSNGWFSDTIRVCAYRMMVDGTCQMTGWAKKSTNPSNGETWMSGLPSIYRPLQTWSFLTPTPGRAYNGTQSIEMHTDGSAVIFDMAAATGSISLDGIRFTALY